MIEGQLYAREGKSLTNFSQTLPPEQSEMAVQVLRDPYNFDFLILTSSTTSANAASRRTSSPAACPTTPAAGLGPSQTFAAASSTQSGTSPRQPRDFFLGVLTFNPPLIISHKPT